MVLTATHREFVVYWLIVLAAELGLPAPTADRLCDAMDFGDGGPAVATTVNVMKRLERRGLIQVRRYQREREIMIVETGKWTKPARCRRPHWRSEDAVDYVDTVDKSNWTHDRLAKFRMPTELFVQIESAAKASFSSTSEWMRQACREKMQRDTTAI